MTIPIAENQPKGPRLIDSGNLDHITENQVEPKNLKLELYRELSEWGSELIISDRYSDPEDPYREEFAMNPDSPTMHSKWHQWGIVGHLIMAGNALDTTVPKILTDRVGAANEDGHLKLGKETIDDLNKWDLLAIAITVHDIGKFTRRQYLKAKNGPEFGFGGHEAESGSIVRQCHERFVQLGLTSAQIDYVAHCAELHFELGKLRESVKQSTSSYTIAYSTTSAFENTTRSIAESHPEYKREIGIMFLADSLAKTDIHIGVGAITDLENEALFPVMKDVITTRGLSHMLLPAAKQIGVNVATGVEYLKIVL